ncbi:hypothetical protein ACFE04_019861 [Oxalis oulophora]
MMVANTSSSSFDLWKKDSFFSAAEEVQHSADIMESAYRLWARHRQDGKSQENFDQLSKDLQTALGTAKWQLEEFENAVRMSHKYRGKDKTSARHRQFIEAIEHQISRVEASLTKAYSQEGKKPLQWVNLDEEECDDLAMFLSGGIQSNPSRHSCPDIRPIKIGILENNGHKRIDGDSSSNLTSTNTKDTSLDKSTDCVIDIDETDSPQTSDDMICQSEGISTRRTRTSPNYSALKIVIPGQESDELTTNVETTPKEKGIKTLFWKLRCRDNLQEKRAVIYLNQFLSRFGCVQRQLPNSQFQFSCSIRLVLALLLTIFLAGNFFVYFELNALTYRLDSRMPFLSSINFGHML